MQLYAQLQRYDDRFQKYPNLIPEKLMRVIVCDFVANLQWRRSTNLSLFLTIDIIRIYCLVIYKSCQPRDPKPGFSDRPTLCSSDHTKIVSSSLIAGKIRLISISSKHSTVVSCDQNNMVLCSMYKNKLIKLVSF